MTDIVKTQFVGTPRSPFAYLNKTLKKRLVSH